jgi:diguanylate cyclase (GGDEF)-like protein
VNLLPTWWRQADHYEWLSGYLASRSLQKLIRWTVAASTATLSGVTLAMTWSPAGPHRVFGDVAALFAVGWCMGLALLWACRWPSRWQSVCYALTAVFCTAVVCLSYTDPLFGLVGAMAFAMVGGYIAFFHTVRLLVVNLVVAAATTLTLAIRVAAISGDVVLAACAFVVIAVSIGCVPFACQALLSHLGVDVMSSDVDPLCGLLNRRAFYRSTFDLVSARAKVGNGYLTVTMVDLDSFKQLNDSHGHRVGDRALIAVGDVLRRCSDHSAVIARVGGEEFLLADVIPDGDAADRAERLRSAIASTPFDITASVGVASAPLREVSVLGREIIEELIETADAAMYDAKRCGGNQIRHRVAT